MKTSFHTLPNETITSCLNKIWKQLLNVNIPFIPCVPPHIYYTYLRVYKCDSIYFILKYWEINLSIKAINKLCFYFIKYKIPNINNEMRVRDKYYFNDIVHDI